MHGPILGLLTLLFALRVLGQFLVAAFGVIWLPAMEQWDSGLIPYPTLIAIQIFMLLVMIKITRDIWRGIGFFAGTRSLRSMSKCLIGFSVVYAAAMALRYVITMALRPDMRWYGGTIPILFHFVLASFIFTWARYYSETSLNKYL